jgi:hypothetical protein
MMELMTAAWRVCSYVPTRNLLRHGNFRAFHLYHACRMGPMGFDDIMSSWTRNSKATTQYPDEAELSA